MIRDSCTANISGKEYNQYDSNKSLHDKIEVKYLQDIILFDLKSFFDLFIFLKQPELNYYL